MWTTTDLDPAGGRLNRSARSPRPPCFPETRSVANALSHGKKLPQIDGIRRPPFQGMPVLRFPI